MSSHEVQAAETDVAIIGMAGRFPGADDLDSFWHLLREGREGITRFGREELAAAGVPARLLDDPTYVPAHGIIPDVGLFDTGYFEFTPGITTGSSACTSERRSTPTSSGMSCPTSTRRPPPTTSR